MYYVTSSVVNSGYWQRRCRSRTQAVHNISALRLLAVVMVSEQYAVRWHIGRSLRAYANAMTPLQRAEIILGLARLEDALEQLYEALRTHPARHLLQPKIAPSIMRIEEFRQEVVDRDPKLDDIFREVF